METSPCQTSLRRRGLGIEYFRLSGASGHSDISADNRGEKTSSHRKNPSWVRRLMTVAGDDMRKMEPPGRSRPRENWSNVHIVPALFVRNAGVAARLVIPARNIPPCRGGTKRGPARDRPPVATAVNFFFFLRRRGGLL